MLLLKRTRCFCTFRAAGPPCCSLLKDWHQTTAGLLAVDDSTKLSPWLALGCLSPRRVHAEIVRYEAAHGANKSTYFLTFHLLVRDYFR